MTTIRIEVLDQPSRSKGWARYAAAYNGAAIVSTSTGNEWIGGTTKEGDAPEGETIEVTSQVQLMVGARRRKETNTETYRMIVAAGEVTEIYHRPGSQGQKLRITGARMMEG